MANYSSCPLCHKGSVKLYDDDTLVAHKKNFWSSINCGGSGLHFLSKGDTYTELEQSSFEHRVRVLTTDRIDAELDLAKKGDTVDRGWLSVLKVEKSKRDDIRASMAAKRK